VHAAVDLQKKRSNPFSKTRGTRRLGKAHLDGALGSRSEARVVAQLVFEAEESVQSKELKESA
jgi:hypothetical protein